MKFDRRGVRPSFEDVVEDSGLETLVAEFGLRSLIDAGYVAGIDASTMAGFDFLELRLLPAGRQVLGEWHAPVINPPSQSGFVGREIFVSHSSRDSDVAIEIVRLLRSALNIKAGDILCTSVDGYRLPGGAKTIDDIREEILNASVVLGLISYDSIKSAFVMFELGARWGAGRIMVPILCPGVKPGVLGGPLASLNALRVESGAQMHQLISELAGLLEVEVEPASSYESEIEALASLPKRKEWKSGR